MLFLGIVDGNWPYEHYLLYPLKALLIAGIIAWFWRALPPLKPTAMGASVGIGVVGVVVWVGLQPATDWANGELTRVWNTLMAGMAWDSWEIKPEASPCVGLNPFDLYAPAEAWGLFAIRVAGIALVVPVMEELFWRGFLMRWLIQDDFDAVPLGTYQPVSFGVTTLLFASVHGGEWPQAVIVGVIYGAWFVRTKSLGNVMVAHGVTNFLLALYCLQSGEWHFLATVPAAHVTK